MNGICMMLLGEDYRLTLLASLWTLQKHYSGPLAIFTDQPDFSLSWSGNLHIIPVDKSQLDLGARVESRYGAYPLDAPRAGTRHYHCKIKTAIGRLSPFESTLWLDSDTLIVGDISSLFLPPNDQRIRVTQHSDWTTSHEQMRHRFNQLVLYGILHPSQSMKLIKENRPAVNSGVYAVTRSSSINAEWERAVYNLDPFFLHDEFALQLLLPKYPHEVIDDRWNCHPMWSKRKPEEVMVWHCCMQRFGWPQTVELWFQTLREMWEANWGNFRDWWTGSPNLWKPDFL